MVAVKENKNVVMEVKDITLRFGGVTAIEGVDFDILYILLHPSSLRWSATIVW